MSNKNKQTNIDMMRYKIIIFIYKTYMNLYKLNYIVTVTH
jgi:hypothetical protein